MYNKLNNRTGVETMNSSKSLLVSNMMETNKQPFFYNFLIDSKFKIWRHISLIFGLSTIAFNQVFILFHDDTGVLGNNIYWICFATLAIYASIAYLNIYILAPKFLLNKKYVWYAINLFLSVMLLLLLRNALEYFVCTTFGLAYKIHSLTSPVLIIRSVAFCTITSICFLGTLIGMLLKHFIARSEYANQLEKEYIQSEVDNLKEQITPDFLFKILNQTSILVKTEPEKASKMLMKLSQLLRYQLYDCSQNKVILNSDVQFVTNYLALEQLYNCKMNYQVSTTGNISGVFIPPLLLITFVRYAINKINAQVNNATIQLHFEVENESETVFFDCAVSDNKISFGGDDFSSIKQRLDLLYNNNYSLIINQDIIKLQLKKSLDLW